MSNARGFTLIETMIALMIIAAAIMALATSWSGNMNRIRKATQQNNVATLLERKMVELEARFRERPFNEIPEAEAGDFGNDYPQYRWEMKSRELKLPDLTPMILSQDENADQTLVGMLKQMSEQISRAVREVRVSVFVKARNNKEAEFSAVQYFIDWESDMSGALGGAAGGGPTTPPGGSR